jgi:predicted HTH transcriptional regulator
MGRAKNNVLTKGFSGRIGTDIVFKQINGETFYGKYPDRTHVQYSKEQLKYKNIFAEAARFASDIVNDPVKKAAYKPKGRNSVYHAALADFMAANSPGKRPKAKINISAFLEHPALNERQKKAIKYLAKRKNISNAIYQKLNAVSKATATRDLQVLVKLKIFSPPATKGAGALYVLMVEKAGFFRK